VPFINSLAVESNLRGANSVEKKSLISMLRTTKKANVVTAPAKNEGGTSRKVTVKKAVMKKAVY
jgi:broad specificity polyphosphatase/5'/3'-nucleotidase SurE